MQIIENLTIAIPTYNREEKLKKTLKDLRKVNPNLKIKIFDNCSTKYNIEKMLKENFSDLNITLVKNEINLERVNNYNKCLLECETKWLWLLSDDDEVLGDSLQKIIEVLDKYPNLAFYKFSTDGIGEVGVEKEEKIETLEEFIDHYYKDPIYKGGQLVFMSNNIFNIEILKKYFMEMVDYSYMQIPFLIPVFIGLSERKIKVYFSDKKIVKYIPPIDDHWDVLKICLGVSIISHLPLNLDKKYLKRFIKIFNWISLECLFKSILKNKSKTGMYYFELLYNSLYKYHLPFKDKLKYPIYKFLIYLNENMKIDIYTILKKNKNRIKG